MAGNNLRRSEASSAKRSDAALGKLQERRAKAGLTVSGSLSEIAYQRLRQAIHEGVLQPNTHIAEIDLAGWLQMSRTPVRDAMRRLMSEGLLASEPYRGALVATLSEQDVLELYRVRELLEIAAAGWCAANAGEPEIRAMTAILETESRCLRDPHALIDLNRRFHQEICRGAHNRFLQKTLATVQDSIALLGKSNLLSEKRAQESHRQHWAILDAVKKRDRRAAERAARAHVETSLKERLKHVAEASRPQADASAPESSDRRRPSSST